MLRALANLVFYGIILFMKFFLENIRPLIKESWAVSWPMTLIMFYEFLMGMTDVYVAGRISKDVQAAYGLSFQVYFLLLIPAIALSVGGVSVISRLFTAQEKKQELETAVSSYMKAAFWFGLSLAFFGFIAAPWIIQILKVPQEIKSVAINLFRIYSLALFFEFFLINTNAILRSCGRVKDSLRSMTLACVLNIVLIFPLAFKTPLGFMGIAWATLLSLFIAAVVNYWMIGGIPGGHRFSWKVLKEIFNIGWPAALMQVLFNLASLFIFSIIGSLPKNSVEIMAAFTNGLRLESAIFMPAFAFNMANAVVVGNLLGKERKRQAYHAGFVTAGLGVAIVIALLLLVLLNARPILSLLSNDPVVVENSLAYVYISLIFEPVMAWSVILGGGLNGAGYTKTVMVVIGLGLWLIRIPLAYTLSLVFGFGAIGIWWAMNISLLFQCFFLTQQYIKKMRPPVNSFDSINSPMKNGKML
jgi:putative MATE family efflux protein